METCRGLRQQLAVDPGHCPLYRYDPRRREQGLSPLQLDSMAPRISLKDYVSQETRYRMAEKAHPEVSEDLIAEAHARLVHLSGMAARRI
ncbi:MAG: hypothetical protein L6R30_24135 [Thermoanaerobaculia bacterium]|nr:Pyruvate-flavodoxin oxidoreductase [Thermoanaerobaculia bacterium]MCK6482434.1 hypothetical protein [Planctomycetota bacterium]MCK6685501.1 hypothetical protein [Thermoanaerobaculia bacterium]